MGIETMKKWQHGDSGAVVKKAIETNFETLFELVSKRVYEKNFTMSDWRNGTYVIKVDEHNIPSPIAQVYILTANGYDEVLGGYYIDGRDIVLQSDIPFDGKVVIK